MRIKSALKIKPRTTTALVAKVGHSRSKARIVPRLRLATLRQSKGRKIIKESEFKIFDFIKSFSINLTIIALIAGMNWHGLFAIGRTLAYYNDTETSTGNAHIAGLLDFTLNQSNWTPSGGELDLDSGDTVSQDITIIDIDDKSIDFKYIVSSEKTSGNDDFCESLKIEAYLEGVLQYTGPLFDFVSATTTFAITTDEWTFDISLPPDASEYTDKSCQFDFVFSGWQNEFPNQGEGYHDEERSSNVIQSPGAPVDPSVCPFEEGLGRSIIHFNNKTLVASNGLSAATDGPVFGFIPAGTYDITLASYDNHFEKLTQVQSNEQWELIMKDASGSQVATTSPIRDIVDAIEEQVVEKVADDFSISSDVYQFTALHAAYPNTNPNSLRALCALFERGNLPGEMPPSDPHPSGRAADGLLALYTFEEGSGPVVFDVSGVGAPLNLLIPDLSKVSWITGGLSVDSSTLISSFVPGLKLTNGLKATNEITIEAWIRPANTTQAGPARIATLSRDTGLRNFTLAQDADKYTGRLRTTTTGLNGTTPPAPVFTPSGEVDTVLQHVVYTRTPDTAKMYVDGVEAVSQTIGGNFSNWDSSFRFGLANEFSMNRTWLGDYCLVAVYDKDLSPAEVLANFAAGAGACGGIAGVVLNEIYPAPPPSSENPEEPNDREWVELYNGGASSIDVLDWKISELSGGSGAEQMYTISTACSAPSASKVIPYNGASTIIVPGGLLVVEFCTGSYVLNNPGDTVRLYDSASILFDSHTYPDTANGKSHQRIPDGEFWVDPEPTPGEMNKVSMQDLIDAGLDEETIVKIIALLAERGETLLEEESTVSDPFTPAAESVSSSSTEEIEIIELLEPETATSTEVILEMATSTEVMIEEIAPAEENSETPADASEHAVEAVIPEEEITPAPEETLPDEPVSEPATIPEETKETNI